MIGMIAVLLFLTFFNLYPFWMQQVIWQAFCCYVLGCWGILVLRVVLWGIAQHFGFIFWLFPKFRKAYCKTHKHVWPLADYGRKSDFFSPASLFFRLMSLSAIVYMGHQFF